MRRDRGLPKMDWDDFCAVKAQEHADKCSRERQKSESRDGATYIEHFPLFEEDGWVGGGPIGYSSRVHTRAFGDPDFTLVGVGATLKDGYVWLVIFTYIPFPD